MPNRMRNLRPALQLWAQATGDRMGSRARNRLLPVPSDQSARRLDLRSARTRSTTQRQNALALLRSDHEQVSALFEKFEKRKSRLDGRQKEELAAEICQALTVHAQIEEEIFYPACHDHVAKADDLLTEAKVEHLSLKELIAKIEAEKPGSEEYDAQVKVLGEYVKHHVKQEQNSLFPKVRKSDLDLKALGDELTARKTELQQRAKAIAA